MKIKVDVTKYKKRRKKEDMSKAIHYQLQKWTGQTVKRVIRNISGPILKTRSAQLRRSVTGRTFIGRFIKAIIGSGIFGRRAVKYARIHELGGKIRPKRAKMLTIPLPGVKGRAANYPDAFIIRSKKGNLLIVEKSGLGIKPLFALKSEVDIPARHWLSESIRQMKPALSKAMQVSQILSVMKRGQR